MLATLALPGRLDAAHADYYPASTPRPADHARNLEVWKARFLRDVRPSTIAAYHGVTRQAVHVWLKAADRYPETADLRRSHAPAR